MPQKKNKYLTVIKISLIKIWSSGEFFVTLIIEKQKVMSKIQSLDQYRAVAADASNSTAKVIKNFKSENSILSRLWDFASSVPDFRRNAKGNYRHRLGDIIILMIFARMSKCVSRADIIEYGSKHLGKFQRMGMLKNGVPSEPTLCRVENGIDDLAFADRMREFAEWFQCEIMKTAGVIEIICVDGKAARGTVLPNGRNPDIVSAYSFHTGIVLATEACQEKSNEIKAVPCLLDKIDIKGKIVTADAMSMQKDIIDKIREKEGSFLIELKANQRALRYGVEDRLEICKPAYVYIQGPELAHGRIETRTCRVYDGLELIADKEKWGGNLTVIEYESETVNKSTGVHTSEKRLYITNLPIDTPDLGTIIRSHWSVESMHWGLDFNLRQDMIKRGTPKAARNLDTMLRTVYSIFSIWKCLRKKLADKQKGVAQMMRSVSMSFTKLIQFLSQK